MKLSGPPLFLAVVGLVAVACAPESRPGATVDGGPDGSVLGGAGSGGRGGSGGKGGSGGTSGSGGAANATGGSGGSVPAGGQGGGGAAGMPGSGGVPGTGGTGGMMMPPPPPPPGPVAKPTSAALFPGTAPTVSTVVMGDPAPGYFYVVAPSGIMPTPTVEAPPSGQAGLPEGITHVRKVTATAQGSALIIFGFNFRADDGKRWRWIDATSYAGLTFWARASTGPLDVNVTLVDATNITTTDERVGTCAKATMAECPGVTGRVASIGTTWTQVKLRWSDFVHGPTDVQGEVNVGQIGRIDLLYVVPAGMSLEFFLTDVRLATTSELM